MGWDHVVGHTGGFFDFSKFWRSLTKFIDIVKKKSNLSKMKINRQYDQQHGLNPLHRSKPIKMVRNYENVFKNHQLVQNHRHGQTIVLDKLIFLLTNWIVPDQFDWFWPVLLVETMLLVILVTFLLLGNFDGFWQNPST